SKAIILAPPRNPFAADQRRNPSIDRAIDWAYRFHDVIAGIVSVVLIFKMFAVCKDFFMGVYAATAVSCAVTGVS
ncbi:MAG TPA: hypothetical protein VHM93_27010, partial [Candidatus Acidoferrum sp.]|nr:hypothetical protein [Candidatus Acidoferrum sp.]